jgi:MFS family permease
VLLGLQAGVAVDRMRRRPILIATDLLRAASLASIPVAFALNVLTLWQLYAVVFLNGCLTVFFDVAYQSYLPSIVGRTQLVEGNSRLELTRTASQRLGPGVAGVLITLVSAPFAVLADALSYLVSAVFLGAIRRTEPPVARPEDGGGPRRSMRADIVVGLRYVGRHELLAPIAASNGISYLFGNIADAILILFLVTERGFSPAQIGLAFSLGSIGIIGGALITTPLTRALGVGRTLLVASVGSCLSWLPVAFAPDELLFAGLTTTIVALGLFGMPWSINTMSLRQAVTPTAMQGRTTATMRFVSWTAIPVGATLGGILGSLIGLHAAIVVGAVGCVLEVVPVAFSKLRHLRELPVSGGDPEPAIGPKPDVVPI